MNENQVKIYSCGPTVYSFAHIGNFRAYVFMDTLRRVLKLNKYELKHVMNITDVGHLESDADEGEDKIDKALLRDLRCGHCEKLRPLLSAGTTKAAKRENKDPYEIAAFYTDIFFKDMERLNIEKPEIIAKATEHINDMLDFISKSVNMFWSMKFIEKIKCMFEMIILVLSSLNEVFPFITTTLLFVITSSYFENISGNAIISIEDVKSSPTMKHIFPFFLVVPLLLLLISTIKLTSTFSVLIFKISSIVLNPQAIPSEK